jgi:hypothetical protein
MKIIETTDGQFVGINLDFDEPIILNGSEFFADEIQFFSNGITRMSNSNYVIDLVKV